MTLSMDSIVVGTDGSETAERAVRVAGEISVGAGARLHLVSAYQPRPAARIGHLGVSATPASWQAELAREVDQLLQDAASVLAGMGAEVECHARTGDAASAILAVAEEQDADLIVVGNRGMRGAQRFLLGSVPDKVSRYAPCSVMIIRTA